MGATHCNEKQNREPHLALLRPRAPRAPRATEGRDGAPKGVASAAIEEEEGNDARPRCVSAAPEPARESCGGSTYMSSALDRARTAHVRCSPDALRRLTGMTRCCVGSYDLDSGMGAIGRPSASSVSVPKFSIGTADRFAYMGQYMSKKHAKSSSYFGRQSPGPATYNVRGGTNAKGIVTVSDTSGRTPPSYSFSGDVNRPSPFRVGGLPLSPAAAARRLPCFSACSSHTHNRARAYCSHRCHRAQSTTHRWARPAPAREIRDAPTKRRRLSPWVMAT